MNYSLGATVKLNDNLTITVDAYQIDIKDRIIVTGNFTKGTTGAGATVSNLLTNYPDVTAAAFFTNGVNTTTRGLDFVATHMLRFDRSSLETKVSFNVNNTTLNRKPLEDFFASNPGYSAFNPQLIFNATEESRITSAVPQQKGSLTFTYKVGKFSANLRNTYYGEVKYVESGSDGFALKEDRSNMPSSASTQAAKDALLANNQTFKPQVVTDLGIGYSINKTFSVKAGGNNIFNIYPDKLNTLNGNLAGESSAGRLEYSRRATQFGFNGGYWYAGVDIRF